MDRRKFIQRVILGATTFCPGMPFAGSRLLPLDGNSRLKDKLARLRNKEALVHRGADGVVRVYRKFSTNADLLAESVVCNSGEVALRVTSLGDLALLPADLPYPIFLDADSDLAGMFDYSYARPGSRLDRMIAVDSGNALVVPVRSELQIGGYVRRFSGDVDLGWFGILPDRAPRSNLWQAASASLSAGNLRVMLREGSYPHDGDIVINGFALSGSGRTTKLVPRIEEHAEVRITGSGSSLRNLQIAAPNSRRRRQNTESNLVNSFRASNFVIEQVHVSGGSAAGFYFRESYNGTVKGISVTRSRADGVHFTHGCHDIRAVDVMAIDTGDDGVAVVSYANRGFDICKDIVCTNVVSLRSRARGIAIVGGERIRFVDPNIQSSAAAGCYIYSEGRYDTYGNVNCVIDNPVVTDGVQEAKFDNPAVQVGGRAGTRTTPSGRIIGNASWDCTIRNVVVNGTGRGMRAAAALDPGSISCSITGLSADFSGGTKNTKADLLQLNGDDCQAASIRGRNVPRYAINIGRQAGGTLRLSNVNVDGVHTGCASHLAFVLIQPSRSLIRLEIRGLTVTDRANRTRKLINRSEAVPAARVVTADVLRR